MPCPCEQPDAEQVAAVARVRAAAAELRAVIDDLAVSSERPRHFALARTAIEEAELWALRGLGAA